MQGIPHPIFSMSTIGDMSTISDIKFPYLWWFHRREKIDETIASLDDQLQQYLSVFRSYIHDRLQNEWSEVDELITQRRITAEYLDYIYAPGQVLVSSLESRHVAQMEGYQTTGWLMTPSRRDLVKPSIEVTSWSFDGSFKKVRKFLVLPPPPCSTGDFAIRDLAFYPQDFASEETVAALLRRGKMFWKCRKRNYVFHRELAGDGTQSSVDSRFMVDMETYSHMHAKENDQESHQLKDVVGIIEQEQVDQDEPGLPEGFYMCLPTRTFGFNMQNTEKKLGELSEENLNGREIRNALSTARQLEMFRGEPLEYKHLNSVMEETKKFDKYLKEVHRGFTEDDIQRSRSAR
ncbi:hypothetical protein ACJZ2D_016760 [Fusarium nematophilum]